MNRLNWEDMTPNIHLWVLLHEKQNWEYLRWQARMQDIWQTLASPPSNTTAFRPLTPFTPVYVASTLVALLSFTHNTPRSSLHTAPAQSFSWQKKTLCLIYAMSLVRVQKNTFLVSSFEWEGKVLKCTIECSPLVVNSFFSFLHLGSKITIDSLAISS